jgi:hypothetical protein
VLEIQVTEIARDFRVTWQQEYQFITPFKERDEYPELK